MKPWNGFGNRIVAAIEARQVRNRLRDPSSLGDFYRQGGNTLLYMGLPLTETDFVVDAGGYHGEWTSGILTRYGCRSEIFEPVPDFAHICGELFAKNSRVRLHQAALGASNRWVRFSLAGVGTSAFCASTAEVFEAQMVNISDFLQETRQDDRLRDMPGAIGCLKLNIEGGEYEVLEQLLATGDIRLCRSLLIQFHCQPADYAVRYQAITDKLTVTHQRLWGYPMVWERWDLRFKDIYKQS
jgi:FkbM family methyltransferase